MASRFKSDKFNGCTCYWLKWDQVNTYLIKINKYGLYLASVNRSTNSVFHYNVCHLRRYLLKLFITKFELTKT